MSQVYFPGARKLLNDAQNLNELIMVWAVGGSGKILKWNGTTWTPQTSGTSNDLKSIWGPDPTNIWTIGAAGTVLHKTM